MPSFEVRVRVKGTQELQAFFSGNMRRMKDLTVPLKKGRLIMLGSVNKNFTMSGRPLWRPLAFSTLMQKLKDGRSPQPLIRTGKLKRSIVGEVIGRNKLVVGTNVQYAAYHQYGTKRIPKRTFILFQDKDIEQINRAVTDHIVNGKD